MGRGVKVNIEEYITNIEAYLKVGCSLHEACLHGLVPYTTVKDYYDNDENIRKKIDRFKNYSILEARESVVSEMKEDAHLALKYLERKCKDEFSTKTNNENTTTVTITDALKGIDNPTKEEIGE